MGKDKSETKPKYTREFHSGERNKKKLKFQVNLNLEILVLIVLLKLDNLVL